MGAGLPGVGREKREMARVIMPQGFSILLAVFVSFVVAIALSSCHPSSCFSLLLHSRCVVFLLIAELIIVPSL